MVDALAFPKGPRRRDERVQRRRHRADIIREVRAQVMARDSACRVCGRTNGAEMHELVPRSLLRGRPPEEVYTTVNCLRLCARCHGAVTRHEVTLLPVSLELGANGRVEAQTTFRSRHVW